MSTPPHHITLRTIHTITPKLKIPTIGRHREINTTLRIHWPCIRRPRTSRTQIHLDTTVLLANPQRPHGSPLPVFPVFDAAGAEIRPNEVVARAGVGLGVGVEFGAAFSGKWLDAFGIW